MPFDEKTQFLYLSLLLYYYFCSQRGQVVSASNMEMAVSSENFVIGGVRIPLMLQLIFQISTQYKISKGVGLNHWIVIFVHNGKKNEAFLISHLKCQDQF